MTPPFIITPHWSVPNNICAFMTTRLGGVSPAPYDGMNVGSTSGDEDQYVIQNKTKLATWVQEQGLKHAHIPYLKQVHGIHALNLDDHEIRSRLAQGEELEADACYTTTPAVVCAIRIADCMPVLISVPGGVAAIHAGWRSLAQGIITNTLNQLLDVTGQSANKASIWLGPCIGKNTFEVGLDVKTAFEEKHPDNIQAFMSIDNVPDKWLCNLPLIAQKELERYGVKNIHIDGRCTVTDEHLFFSYRRDQKKRGGTGRMMAGIWMKPE